MSKVLKNTLIVLLVALFAAVSLSACGKAEKKEPAKAAETAKPAVEAAKPAAEAVKPAADAVKPAADADKKAGDDDFKPKKGLVFPKNMD